MFCSTAVVCFVNGPQLTRRGGSHFLSSNDCRVDLSVTRQRHRSATFAPYLTNSDGLTDQPADHPALKLIRHVDGEASRRTADWQHNKQLLLMVDRQFRRRPIWRPRAAAARFLRSSQINASGCRGATSLRMLPTTQVAFSKR
jgi:hypothetical protein